MAGTIYRVVRSQDYATIATYHLRDKRLTLAAKGLMSILLGDEGDAAYTVSDLTERGPEGRDAIRSAIKRLEDCGYIRKRQLHGEGGRFAQNEMIIYESPFTENPSTVEPFTVEPFTENPKTVEAVPELELDNGLSEAPTEARPRKTGEQGRVNQNPPTNPPDKGPKWKPERFAAFWAFYRTHCRGESKHAAVRAWDRLRPDDELIAEIGHALRRQLRTEEWQRGIGIPYASTYLNQRRWEDDITDRRGAPGAPVEEEDVTYWTPGGDDG